jgi:hypothetical protein
LSEEAALENAPGIPVGLSTWQDQKLHHWLVLARKYGRARPSKLEKKYAERAAEEREAFMRRVLGLPDAQSRISIDDAWGNAVVVNDRIIQKTLKNPPRTPSVAWLRFAIVHAIELWEKTVKIANGTEVRQYYLAAVNQPEKRGVVVIAAGGVAFNVIDCDASYADNLRSGKLLAAAYTDDRKYCQSHKCCHDVVEMENMLTKAERERHSAQEDARQARKRLKMKNPPA